MEKVVTICLVSLISFWGATSAWAGYPIRFNVVPEESTVSYIIDGGDNPVNETYQIQEGTLELVTGLCGSNFIKFKSATIITIPEVLPRGEFTIKDDFVVQVTGDEFYGNYNTGCALDSCIFFSHSDGSFWCISLPSPNEISGSIKGKELSITGRMKIESSSWETYVFSIKAEMIPRPKSESSWLLFLPAINAARKASQDTK